MGVALELRYIEDFQVGPVSRDPEKDLPIEIEELEAVDNLPVFCDQLPFSFNSFLRKKQ